jgi:hypothetical protein
MVQLQSSETVQTTSHTTVRRRKKKQGKCSKRQWKRMKEIHVLDHFQLVRTPVGNAELVFEDASHFAAPYIGLLGEVWNVALSAQTNEETRNPHTSIQQNHGLTLRKPHETSKSKTRGVDLN